eukprot:gene34655-44807_t
MHFGCRALFLLTALMIVASFRIDVPKCADEDGTIDIYKFITATVVAESKQTVIFLLGKMEENSKLLMQKMDKNMETMEFKLNASSDKMDKNMESMEFKLNANSDKMDRNMESMEFKLNAKMDKMDKNMESMELKLNAKMDKNMETMMQKMDKNMETMMQKMDKNMETTELKLNANSDKIDALSVRLVSVENFINISILVYSVTSMYIATIFGPDFATFVREV